MSERPAAHLRVLKDSMIECKSVSRAHPYIWIDKVGVIDDKCYMCYSGNPYGG